MVKYQLLAKINKDNKLITLIEANITKIKFESKLLVKIIALFTKSVNDR